MTRRTVRSECDHQLRRAALRAAAAGLPPEEVIDLMCQLLAAVIAGYERPADRAQALGEAITQVSTKVAALRSQPPGPMNPELAELFRKTR